MLVFRCTKRAAKRFKLELADPAPASHGVLGDWYVNLLNIGPARLVLCVSERSLLPVVLPARNDVFPSQFGTFLGPMLHRLGVKDESIQQEQAYSKEFSFAPTRSRLVLGVMNDYANLAEGDLLSGRVQELLELSMGLAQAPMSPISYESPDRLTVALFAAARM